MKGIKYKELLYTNRQTLKLTLFLVLLFSVRYFSANTNLIQPKDTIKVDSLVAFATHYLGTNYLYGSIQPQKGFDCSGFVYFVFNHFKLKVPRSSMDYEKEGQLINPDSCKKGDVIVFTGTNAKNRTPGHVGIILSNPGEDITFIHSSSSKKGSGVKISSYKDAPYYKVRFIKIVRIATIL